MQKETRVKFVRGLFQLKSLLSYRFGKDDDSRVKNVSAKEYLLMKEVAENHADLAQIREYLCVSKSAVSQMLKALERKGYLVREVDPANRRNLIVTLTEAGERAVEVKEAEFDAQLEQICRDMDDREIGQLIGLVNQLSETIARVRPPMGEVR